MSEKISPILIFFLLLLGAWLRVNQFQLQVLLDDEWHAVHQLLQGKTPGELFVTLGLADYSIPTGIYYYWLSQWGGLTEFAMRLPFLAASLLTLMLFTAYVWQHFSAKIALIFVLLFSLSPLLVIYAHTARPYALTLLLAYLALFFFYEYWQSSRSQWRNGLAYIFCAALCFWLHLITGPLVIAPLVLETARALLRRRWRDLRRLLMAGLPATALMALLVTPPLVFDSQALLQKSNLAEIDWNTAVGVWYMWFGSGSTLLVAVLAGFALLGLQRMLRHDKVLQAACAGVAMTLALIIVAQPQWVQHSLTMARYLLPLIPLLLLACACGISLLLDFSARNRMLRTATGAGLLALAIFYAMSSPSWHVAQQPNSQITHSLLQFDFRADHNSMQDYQQQHLVLSPFWERLATHPIDSLRIAVAPFYFETYNWGAPAWESASRQRIFPAYLNGYCLQQRSGEVPRNAQFRFANVYYLDQLGDTTVARPDWLVYTKPFTGYVDGVEDQLVGGETLHCLEQLTQQLGPANYVDDLLMAWHLGDD